jgi:5-methyltetrahydrofolate--homocysteine methyltransferase
MTVRTCSTQLRIVGEDEKGYISSILEKIGDAGSSPILVDSTEADVIEEALREFRQGDHQFNQSGGEKRTSKVPPAANGMVLLLSP